jgi:hypothetical protein
MLGLLIAAVILGFIVSGITGVGFLFWIVAGAVFLCGLPGALVTSFVFGAIDYAQDRADYRMEMEMAAEEERLEREIEADEYRTRQLSSAIRRQKRPQVNVDARQVRIYGRDT